MRAVALIFLVALLGASENTQKVVQANGAHDKRVVLHVYGREGWASRPRRILDGQGQPVHRADQRRGWSLTAASAFWASVNVCCPDAYTAPEVGALGDSWLSAPANRANRGSHVGSARGMC